MAAGEVFSADSQAQFLSCSLKVLVAQVQLCHRCCRPAREQRAPSSLVYLARAVVEKVANSFCVNRVRVLITWRASVLMPYQKVCYTARLRV